MQKDRLTKLSLGMAVIMGLTACSGIGSSGRTEFQGAAAADEPRAVQAARAVMRAGGNAFDAATALYFTLSVSLPSMATLGGGGVCLVHAAPPKNETRILEFFAEAPAYQNPSAARPSAVPGNMRGFFALHERYGLMPWGDVLKPGEELARSGLGFSRAFVEHLNIAAGFIIEDPEVRRLFFAGGKRRPEVGDRVPQLDLSALLGRVRAKGPGEFYSSSLGQRFIAAVKEAEGSLSMEDLRQTPVRWRQPVILPLSEEKTLYLAPAPSGAGIVAAQIYLMMKQVPNAETLQPGQKAHLFAEAAMRAFLDRRNWINPAGEAPVATPVPSERLLSTGRLQQLMANFSLNRHTTPEQIAPKASSQLENPAGTSFTVADTQGNAVACSLTPNNPFGSGRIAKGTGVFIGAAPDVTRGGPISLAPMMVMDEDGEEVYLSLSGAGGVAVPTAIAHVLNQLDREETRLKDAFATGRLHHSGVPDTVYYEKNSPASEISALQNLQYDAQAFPEEVGGNPARLNAIYCPDGLRHGDCEAAHDPRGKGFSFGPILTQ